MRSRVREEEDGTLFSFRKAELQILEGYLGILSTTLSTLINTESLLYQVLRKLKENKTGSCLFRVHVLCSLALNGGNILGN